MSARAGSFVWYELMTSDVEAARAFYGELIGWRVLPWEQGEMDYRMFAVGDRPVAGLMALPPEAARMGAPPHWLGYVDCVDVDATTRHAEALGGKALVPPTEIPRVGRFSLVQDPQGAMLAPLHSVDEMAKAAPGPGDISWHELATSDVELAWRFYLELYGWQHSEDLTMGALGTYRLFMAGPHDGGGIYRRPADMPAPPHWLYYLQVTDLDDCVRRCGELRGRVVQGPHEVPGGDRVALCQDPQGAVFGLHWRHG